MTSHPTSGPIPDPATDPVPVPQPDPHPLQYVDAGPYVPVMSYPPRPTSVTVTACIGIALGALGLLCKPASLLVFVVKLPIQNPVVDAMRNDSFIRGWMVVGVATGWLISLLLVLASVGSLRLRDWGRLGMLAYAGLALVMTVVSQVIGVVAVNPALEPAMKQAAAQQPSPFQMSPTAGAIIAVVLGLWFPLLILVVYNRRPVKEAFSQGPAPAEAKV